MTFDHHDPDIERMMWRKAAAQGAEVRLTELERRYDPVFDDEVVYALAQVAAELGLPPSFMERLRASTSR